MNSRYRVLRPERQIDLAQLVIDDTLVRCLVTTRSAMERALLSGRSRSAGPTTESFTWASK
jgi:hypothetical protein